MLYVLEGQPVSVNIPFVDASGNKQSVSSVAYEVRDGNDKVVFSAPSVDVTETETFFQVKVDAQYNIAGPSGKSAYSIIVSMQTESRVIKVTQFYIVEKEQRLTVMKNSFMTLAQAFLESSEFVNLPGWSNATERRQVAALSQAYSNITQMTLEYTPINDDGVYMEGYEEIIGALEWSQMTANKFDDLPPVFTKALMRAQILEANDLLEGNVMTAKINSGVRSETIGESSITFNTSLMQHQVSRAAMGVLGRYVYRSHKLART